MRDKQLILIILRKVSSNSEVRSRSRHKFAGVLLLYDNCLCVLQYPQMSVVVWDRGILLVILLQL